MVEQLRTKAEGAAMPVMAGDMASTRVPGEFGLVYLVGNTIMNVTTQTSRRPCSPTPPITSCPVAASWWR